MENTFFLKATCANFLFSSSSQTISGSANFLEYDLGKVASSAVACPAAFIFMQREGGGGGHEVGVSARLMGHGRFDLQILLANEGRRAEGGGH